MELVRVWVKFDRFDVVVSCFGGRLERVMVVNGMKKQVIVKFWINCGYVEVLKFIFGLKVQVCQQKQIVYIIKLKVISCCMLSLCVKWLIIGDRMIGIIFIGVDVRLVQVVVQLQIFCNSCGSSMMVLKQSIQVRLIQRQLMVKLCDLNSDRLIIGLLLVSFQMIRKFIVIIVMMVRMIILLEENQFSFLFWFSIICRLLILMISSVRLILLICCCLVLVFWLCRVCRVISIIVMLMGMLIKKIQFQ